VSKAQAVAGPGSGKNRLIVRGKRVTLVSGMPPWLQLVGPIASIVAATVAIMRAIHGIKADILRVERRLEHIEIRIASLEHQNRALLKAFPQVVSTLVVASL
jgi:hypothetical protein